MSEASDEIAKRYTYCVTWSDEDRQFVGTCVEFPSMSFLDDRAPLAVDGIVVLVKAAVRDMIASGETPPVPQGPKW